MDQLPRDWLKELPLLQKPTLTTMIMLLILINQKPTMTMDPHPTLPRRDWLKEMPLLTLIPTIILLLIRDLPLTSSRDWLKEMPLLTLIPTIILLLIRDL